MVPDNQIQRNQIIIRQATPLLEIPQGLHCLQGRIQNHSLTSGARYLEAGFSSTSSFSCGHQRLQLYLSIYTKASAFLHTLPRCFASALLSPLAFPAMLVTHSCTQNIVPSVHTLQGQRKSPKVPDNSCICYSSCEKEEEITALQLSVHFHLLLGSRCEPLLVPRSWGERGINPEAKLLPDSDKDSHQLSNSPCFPSTKSQPELCPQPGSEVRSDLDC